MQNHSDLPASQHSVSQNTLLEKVRTQQDEKQKYLTTFSIIYMVAPSPFVVIYLLMGLLGGGGLAYFLAVSVFCVPVTGFVAYKLSKKKKFVTIACWLVNFVSFLAVSIFFFVLGVSVPMFSIYPILIICSLFLLPRAGTLFFMVLSLAAVVTLYFITLNGYDAPLQSENIVNTLMSISVCAAAVIVPTILVLIVFSRLRRSLDLTNKQNSLLEQAFHEKEQKRAIGEDVSRQVFSLITGLNANVAQQSSGNKEQVTSISQITSFLGELTATAQNIADQIKALNLLSQGIKHATVKVRETSKEVGEAGENGATMVEATLSSSQRLYEVYQELKVDLASLGEQQGQVKEIATTIRSISEETRLLALNALIEAAGAGQYGERFGVVAGEVKSLADKAGQASQEINLILKGVGELIEKVLEVSERWQSQMQEVLQSADASGKVIRHLVNNIYENSVEVEEVERDIFTMDNHALEIQMASNQQYNSSQQALETLRFIGIIAGQNANSSEEVNNNTNKLERLSHDLLTALVS